MRALAIAALLAACSSSKEPAPSNTPKSTPEKPKAGKPAVGDLAITFVPVDPGSASRDAMMAAVDGIRRRIEDLGLEKPMLLPYVEGEIVVELRGADAARADEVKRAVLRPGTLGIHRVDSDAPAMREVYSQISRRGVGGPLTAETETWVGPSGSRHTDIYLKAPDRAALVKELATLAATDRIVGYERVRADGGEHWRSYWLDKTPILDQSDVQSGSVQYDQTSNRPVVAIDFKADGAKRFAEATAKNLGNKLAIVVDGVVMSAPVVQSKIDGGKVQISMGGGSRQEGEQEARDLLRGLRLGALPPLKVASEKPL